MTPAQVLLTIKLLIFAGALSAAALFAMHYRGLIRDNDDLRVAAEANTAAIRTLTTRIRATEQATADLSADAASTRTQVTRGISQLDKARRNDPETQKVDRPWPAAVRFRVFDDPDPTTGSTARAGVAPTGGSGVAAPQPRRPDAGSDGDAAGHR